MSTDIHRLIGSSYSHERSFTAINSSLQNPAAEISYLGGYTLSFDGTVRYGNLRLIVSAVRIEAGFTSVVTSSSRYLQHGIVLT